MFDNESIVNSDSSSQDTDLLDNSIDISYEKFTQGLPQRIDSSILHFHRDQVLSIWDMNLGNNGTAYSSLRYQPFRSADVPIAFFNNEAYKFRLEEESFFNTTKPFTSIDYRIGAKQEQYIELMHTQNIKPQWNFMAGYRKMNSPGFYQAQKSNIDNVHLTMDYQAPGLNYKFKAAFVYNKLQIQENLGVRSLDTLDLPLFNNRRLVPINASLAGTNESAVTNYNRDLNIRLDQSYTFGKKDTVYNADSTQKFLSLKPYFSLKNQVYLRNEAYQFKNQSPDSTVNFELVQTINLDSTFMEYRESVLGTNFSTEVEFAIGEQRYYVQPGIGIESQSFRGLSNTKGLLRFNNYVFAELHNLSKEPKGLKLDGHFKFFMSGRPQGNLELDGRASLLLSEDIGRIGVRLSQYVQAAPFAFQSLQYDTYALYQNFSKQSVSMLSGFYENDGAHFKASLSSYLIANPFFFDTQLQYLESIPLLQVEASKKIFLKKFYMDHQVLFQLVAEDAPIKLPVFASRHILAYSNDLFESNLKITTGLDLGYNSNFNVYDYNPVLLSFIPSTTQGRFVPRVGYFFNFKVKKFRASVFVDHLQQLLLENNIRYGSYYASPNMLVRLGLNWSFVN